MSTQGWHTLVISGYKKYNFPTAVNDRLQRDIFIIGLNDTFKLFCSEVFARENSSTLSFTQVIFKARDFEAALKTELAIAKHRFEEAAHKITPAIEKSKLRTGLHVFQVRRPAFKVGAHHMQTTVTAPPQTTLAMAMKTRVIGNKYAGPLPYTSCQKPLPALELICKRITLSS